MININYFFIIYNIEVFSLFSILLYGFILVLAIFYEIIIPPSVCSMGHQYLQCKYHHQHVLNKHQKHNAICSGFWLCFVAVREQGDECQSVFCVYMIALNERDAKYLI